MQYQLKTMHQLITSSRALKEIVDPKCFMPYEPLQRSLDKGNGTAKLHMSKLHAVQMK
jgi:hypothetical protein